MAELFAHQREALAVAARRSVLLCSAGRVGKTLLAAMRVRAWLLAVAHGVHSGQQPPKHAICVALAPTPEMRAALRRELARLCSAPVWMEAAAPTRDDDMAELARQLARLLLQDAPSSPSTATATDAAGAPSLERVRVVILSPKLFQTALRKRLLQMQHIALLVLEGADEIHDTAPSLYRQAFEDEGAPMPLIFATTSTLASALEWDPARNPLMRHIQVLNLVPVVPHEAAAVMGGQREPPLPLLLSEPFEADASGDSSTTLPCAVRDFLLGENKKKIDYVRIFRMEIEMGNSAAVYDEKKKQERVNRFIQDAESVYQHLGLWCLLKYVELELQFNLQACLVEDVDNINRRRRAHLLQQQQQHKNPELAPMPDQEGNGVDEEEIDEEDEPEGPSVRGSKTLEALVESASPNLDEVKLKSIKGIIKVLSSLSKEAVEVGVRAASPRLQKVASITRCRLMLGANSPVDRPANGDTTSTAPRCWVFVERRTHCTVVAEYLTFALSDLGIPPCCSMLGHSNARVVGSLHFSSYLKIITKFKTGATNVLVTTSIANKSQRTREEPPQCDLVVIMDETQEPEKLIDYCHRAYTRGGVVKYVTPRGHAEERKFQVLVGKFKEAIELEAPAEVSANNDQLMEEDANPSPAVVSQTPTQSVPTPKSNTPIDPNVKPAASKPAEVPSASTTKPRSPVPAVRSRPSVSAPAVTYEIVYKDTGAKLSLENSVSVLSKFCETLPGLDTYDRRPQYYIKRHQIAGPGMTASMKQQKKKKLKYNCNLEDKIDDIKAQAEAREDADVDMDTEKTDESYSSSGRFLFTAKLRLPAMIGAKKEIGSPKVSSDIEAKAIVAFKGCQELIKKGLLDRHFRSTLEYDTPVSDPNNTPASDTTVYVDDEDPKKSSQSLTDLSAQNSYDLPPVGAAELGLPTVRSLMDAATVSRDGDASRGPTEEVTVSMCFYAIEGIRYAILSSKKLYTGNTNTGWRYDFATSDVMEPVINKVTLRTKAIPILLTKSQLEELLHFHLVIMRLACMKVDDAMREIDVKGDKVWNEFSEQNDKGYLVVPSRLADNSGSIELDWEYLRDIVGKPLLLDCWPLPAEEVRSSNEWVCVPKFRRNVCYEVRAVTKQKASEVVKPMAEVDSAWAAHFKTKPVAGVPIFGRWHSREQVKEADPDQPLLHGVQVPEIVPLIRRVMQRHLDEGSIAQSKSKFQERYLLPELTSLLRLTKTQYFEAMGIVPLLYEFERKCQLSNLMMRIGLDVDLRLLDDATSKPDYERLEILGDTFLKLETSWHLFENRQDILEEGQLTQLRRDIIRNDRLNMFALTKNLHHFILYPAEIEQHPFKFWKPSCMGKTPENIVVPSKWVADVLEAICGACLVNGGEVDGRHFLKWVGVTVPDDRHLFQSPRYIHDAFPNNINPDSTVTTLSRQRDLGFRVHRFDGITDRLVALQQRLKYTFNNKELLLEAITHPSVGALSITWDASSKAKTWYKNYERLEYLGDAVIEYLTLSYAFNKYHKWLPGSLSQWKSATVSNDALGKTAIMCFGIDECLLSGALRIDRESLTTVASLERRYPRDAALSLNTHELLRSAKTKTAGSSRSQSKRKAPPAATAINSLGLPKMFADVFEALVAAVFLDSRHDLRTVRDVFLGPLIDVVGDDAFAYVCRESGLPMNNDPLFQDDDFMGELSPLSEDEDDA